MKKDVTGYRRLVMLSCNKREHDDEDWKKKKKLKKEVFFKGKKSPAMTRWQPVAQANC